MSKVLYGNQFNPDVVKDLLKINEKIKEEIENDTMTGQKMNEMEMNYLLKGMQLQNNIYNKLITLKLIWK